MPVTSMRSRAIMWKVRRREASAPLGSLAALIKDEQHVIINPIRLLLPRLMPVMESGGKMHLTADNRQGLARIIAASPNHGHQETHHARPAEL